MTQERHAVALPGAKLALVLHLPAAAPPFPCVVACHGLSASKDTEKYLLLGEEFSRAGMALARFDFRGCGESSGREDETTVTRGRPSPATWSSFLEPTTDSPIRIIAGRPSR